MWMVLLCSSLKVLLRERIRCQCRYLKTVWIHYQLTTVIVPMTTITFTEILQENKRETTTGGVVGLQYSCESLIHSG